MIFKLKLIYLPYNFKAIHNKDDSVVKTFGVGQLTPLFF